MTPKGRCCDSCFVGATRRVASGRGLGLYVDGVVCRSSVARSAHDGGITRPPPGAALIINKEASIYSRPCGRIPGRTLWRTCIFKGRTCIFKGRTLWRSLPFARDPGTRISFRATPPNSRRRALLVAWCPDERRRFLAEKVALVSRCAWGPSPLRTAQAKFINKQLVVTPNRLYEGVIQYLRYGYGSMC